MGWRDTLNAILGRPKPAGGVSARTKARPGKALITGRFVVLKPFKLRYDGKAIFIADERVLYDAKGEQVTLDEFEWPPILGDYHPGHTYALNGFNAEAVAAAHRLGLCAVVATVNEGLSIR